MEELQKKTCTELKSECKVRGIKGYSTKNKDELIRLLLPTPPSIPPQTPPLRFIDVFCGIGGFHQALKNMGAQCVFACDIDKDCRKTYAQNYHITPESDITTVKIPSIPSFDILCAGFPCQPFSKAGFQNGFEDTRGTLFFHLCKIAEHHQPKYMILENVRNLASHDDGNTWKTIKASIEALGYTTYETPMILNTMHFNIPQNRERVILLCKRKDLGELPPFPNLPNAKQRLVRTIQDVIDPTTPHEKYGLSPKMKVVEDTWNSFLRTLLDANVKIPHFPLWTDWWDKDFVSTDPFYKKYTSWIDKNRAFYEEHKALLTPWLTHARTQAHWVGAVRKFEWQAGTALPTDSMKTLLWTARGSGIRVKRPDYIPTLVAMSMIPVYGPLSRKLSPRELLRLQSFPDDFQYDEKKIYKQVGNAVNVTMIERSARFLILGEPLVL